MTVKQQSSMTTLRQCHRIPCYLNSVNLVPEVNDPFSGNQSETSTAQRPWLPVSNFCLHTYNLFPFRSRRNYTPLRARNIRESEEGMRAPRGRESLRAST